MAESGEWAVVQQDMNDQDRTARRYHWLSEHVQNFVVEPHDAIVGDAKRESVLNMTAKESESCRKASTDLAKRKTRETPAATGIGAPSRSAFASEVDDRVRREEQFG